MTEMSVSCDSEPNPTRLDQARGGRRCLEEKKVSVSSRPGGCIFKNGRLVEAGWGGVHRMS